MNAESGENVTQCTTKQHFRKRRLKKQNFTKHNIYTLILNSECNFL